MILSKWEKKMMWKIIHMHSYYRQRRAAPLKMYRISVSMCKCFFPFGIWFSSFHSNTSVLVQFAWKQILVTECQTFVFDLVFFSCLNVEQRALDKVKDLNAGKMHSLLNFRLVKNQNHWFWYVREIFMPYDWDDIWCLPKPIIQFLFLKEWWRHNSKLVTSKTTLVATCLCFEI